MAWAEVAGLALLDCGLSFQTMIHSMTWLNPWHLSRAAAALHAGGVIAYATEAVFGLGCDPADEAALARVLDLKRRPAHKGLILNKHRLSVDY